MKEVSTFLCYEATASLKLESCEVKTRVQSEQGQRVAERIGVVPVLRGGLGMVEAMTEMVSNAQVWHLGIYRDKKSLLPIEYYNKLPKQVGALRRVRQQLRLLQLAASCYSCCSKLPQHRLPAALPLLSALVAAVPVSNSAGHSAYLLRARPDAHLWCDGRGGD